MVGYFTTQKISRDFEATIVFESGDSVDLESFSPKSYETLKHILMQSYETDYNLTGDIDEEYDLYGLAITRFISNDMGIKGTKMVLSVIDQKQFFKFFKDIKLSAKMVNLNPIVKNIIVTSPNAIGMFM